MIHSCRFITPIFDVVATHTKIVVFLTDVPGAPTHLHDIDVTTDSITLQWSKPRYDGGSRIRNYIVEYRDTTRHTWSQAASIDSHRMTHTVINLKPSTDYYFRVSAENDIGIGEPCEMTTAIRTRAEMQSK